MEIKEIVSFYINERLQVLEVSFKTIDDGEDEIRTDQIDLFEVENFGFKFLSDDIISMYTDLESDEFDLKVDDKNFDEDEIISFLNEYYLIYSDRVPKTTIY
jgi:hypothetical protein